MGMTLEAWVRSLRLKWMVALLGGVLFPSFTNAQIVPDGTLGTQVFGACGGTGGGCGITNGTTRGSNLFHSFQQFSLPSRDIASFISDPGIQNVIVRVTGVGQPFISNINGTIETLDPAFNRVSRNFFLLNPNGIVFGPGAALLNGGSFLATTAERMLFQDGTVFDTRDTTVNPLLTVSVQIGLQMGQTPGNIQMQDSFLSAGVSDDFTSFTLLGGNVSLDNTRVITPGQRVEIGAIARAGNVGLSANGSLSVPDGVPRGDISFSNGSRLDVRLRSGSGGDIGITANNIRVLSGSQLLAGILPGLGTTTSQAGDITLNATEQLQVAGQSSLIATFVDTNALGNSGNLVITVNSLEVLNRAILAAATFGTGNVGNVVISARDRVLFDNGNAFSTVGIGGGGKGGNIQIDTNSLDVRNRAILTASTFGTGDAGNVIITARDRVLFSDNGAAVANVLPQAKGRGGNIQIDTNSLEVRNEAQLDVSTSGTGDAGNVIITARDRVLFDNGFAFSSINAGAGGRGGNIQIDTNSLDVRNGAQLSASTFGTGDAGNVVITSNSLEVRNGAGLNAVTRGRGDAGNVVISARDRVLFDNGTAGSSVLVVGAEGKGGNVQIDTNSLDVRNGAQLSASTRGTGDAGNVVIMARDRALFSGTSTDGQSPSAAFSSVERGAVGKGGNVQIDTNSLDVRNGAQLSASTRGTGDAGNVVITARDRVLFDNGDAFSSVQAGAVGEGGNVQINTNSLEVLNGAQLRAETDGAGDAGNVLITVRDRVLFSGTSADGRFPSAAFSNVDARAEGKGGNVQIDTNSLDVRNGAQLRAETDGAGDAGNVVITARDRVLFSGSAAFSNVGETGVGKGGNVEISTNSLEVLNAAQLLAITSGTGDAGNVVITARDSVRVSGIDSLGFSSGLFTSTFTGSNGNSGDITVNTRAFQVSDGGVVDARTRAIGNSGNVTINAATVDLLNGGQLLAITGDRGRAGSVTVNASERLTIAGTDVTYTTRLAQFGFATPVSASSGIYVQSQATGGAGDITVTAPQIRMDQGVISAESAAVDGGNITLNIRDLLLMRRGSQISATAGTAQQGGNGGNITINVPRGFIIGVKGENSDITANAFTGSGGRVNITAQGIFGLEFRPRLTPFSDITASSTFGASGIVTLNTLNVDPSRGLVQLPANLIDTNRILANSCIVRDKASGGVFLVTGKGGFPEQPGSMLPTFATGEVRGVEKKEEGRRKKEEGESGAIAEVDGIYQLPDGQIILSWECGRR